MNAPNASTLPSGFRIKAERAALLRMSAVEVIIFVAEPVGLSKADHC